MGGYRYVDPAVVMMIRPSLSAVTEEGKDCRHGHMSGAAGDGGGGGVSGRLNVWVSSEENSEPVAMTVPPKVTVYEPLR